MRSRARAGQTAGCQARQRAPGREERRDDHEPACGGVEEEVIPRRDDREEHERRIGGTEQAHPAAARERVDGRADEQGVAEVQARHGRERVVEAAERVRAQVDVCAAGDRVREAEAREARRRRRIEDVDRERDRGRDHERRADDREALAVRAVHPREHAGGRRQVQAHVGEAEQRRHDGQVRDGALQRALDEDADVLLERDDVGGVRTGRREARGAEAADALVEAVQRGDRGELDLARVGGERRRAGAARAAQRADSGAMEDCNGHASSLAVEALEHIGRHDDSDSSRRTNSSPGNL